MRGVGKKNKTINLMISNKNANVRPDQQNRKMHTTGKADSTIGFDIAPDTQQQMSTQIPDSDLIAPDHPKQSSIFTSENEKIALGPKKEPLLRGSSSSQKSKAK